MMAIEKNPDQWRQVRRELIPGDAWDFRVDIESFPARDNSDYASIYLSLVLDIIKNAGGGIPLIVENNLNDDWQQVLNDAAERPLGDAPLAMLAATLKDIPIYVTGDSDLVDAPGDVEGKMFWTLSSDQFSRHHDAPDLTKVCLLIYVKNLIDVEINLRLYQADTEVRMHILHALESKRMQQSSQQSIQVDAGGWRLGHLDATNEERCCHSRSGVQKSSSGSTTGTASTPRKTLHFLRMPVGCGRIASPEATQFLKEIFA
jgi:hypothetical protein